MSILALRVKGDYQGQEVVLLANVMTGSEIISVGSREVSRKRSFGLSTTHDLSTAGLDVDVGVVKSFPLRLELHKKGEVVATFKHPTAIFILVLLLGAGAALGFLMARLLAR